MSIKTLRKRIALVAVSALGVGVLSVTPAFAAAGDVTVDLSATTGLCAASDSSGALAFGAGDTDIVSELATPITLTALVGASIVLTHESTFVTYTAGGLVSTTGFADAAPVLHPVYNVFDAEEADTVTYSAQRVGTVTVNTFATDPFSALNTPATVFGTPEGRIIISIVASCSATTYSVADSEFNVATTFDSGPELTDGDVLTFAANQDAYLNLVGRNGYGQAMPSTTVWIATATNNAKVKIGTSTTIDDTGTTDGTSSFATTTAAGTIISVRISAADAVKGGSTTVTLTADGVTAASRTITFLGEATAIKVVANKTGVVGGEGLVVYQLTDSAGNSVPGSVSAVSTTYTNRVNVVSAIKSATIVASDLSPLDSETINGVDAATVVGGSAEATSTYGLLKFGCTTSGGTGSATVTLRHTNVVTGDDIDLPVALNCAGGISTFTVSMDKASYKIGEIATLTITAKDSTGAAVNDFATMGTGHVVSAGGGTLVKASANDDAFTVGARTYQVQMTTEGTFNVAVNIAGLVTKSATASYSVTPATVAVSNAEVLAAIVKLIASINKQIKALQKSLKR